MTGLLQRRSPTHPPVHLPPATVNVFLPSYNRRAYLAQCLESVLAQSFHDFHVLVVDDASPDGSDSVAKDYQNRFPGKITAICKPRRRGVAHSMRLGVPLLLRAPFIAFIADDDLWLPRKLELQLEKFATDPALGLVATEARYIDEHGAPTGTLFSDVCGRPNLDAPAKAIFHSGNFVCGSSPMVRREALTLVQQYPLNGICSDMYTWLIIAAHTRVGWVPEPVTLYRQSASSLTVTHAEAMEREIVALRRHAYNHIAAVQEAVGGPGVARQLDDQVVYRALAHLRAGHLRQFAWYFRHALRTCSARMILVLLYQVSRTAPVATARLLLRKPRFHLGGLSH